MVYDPKRHHRRSIRLRGYDYAQAGAYFVTIVTQGRECLFGQVVNGEMRLNDAGRIAQDELLRTAVIRPRVTLDAFVVMPNHIHDIIVLSDHGRGTLQRAPTTTRSRRSSACSNRRPPNGPTRCAMRPASPYGNATTTNTSAVTARR